MLTDWEVRQAENYHVAYYNLLHPTVLQYWANLFYTNFVFCEEEEESDLQYDCVLVSVTLPTPNHTVSRFLLHIHENEICIKQKEYFL